MAAPDYLAGDTELALPQSLAAYARSHPVGGVLVLISDLFDTVPFLPEASSEAGAEALADALRYFTPPRWQVLVMHLLTEAEIHPTLEGDFDLRDVETRESLPFHFDEATLARYRLRVRQWSARLQSVCAWRGAAYSRIIAEWPMEKAVVPYLRQRGVLQ
jgi:hypothetical protein